MSICVEKMSKNWNSKDLEQIIATMIIHRSVYT